jgi:FlaG/FlaF family flagellin (archaellin)
MSENAEAGDGQMAPEQTYAEYPTEEQPAPFSPPTFMQRLMGNKVMLFGVIGIVAVMVIVAAVFAGGGAAVFGGGKAPPAPMKMSPMTGDYSLNGPQVAAGSTAEYPIEFNSSENSSEVTNVYEVSAACSWTDDYAGSEPDSMTFELVSPAGQNVSQTTEGANGNANIVLKDSNVTESKMVDNTGGWTLRVTCNFAGHKDVGPFGFLIYTDAGNNFSAKISYKYYGHGGAKTNSTK